MWGWHGVEPAADAGDASVADAGGMEAGARM